MRVEIPAHTDFWIRGARYGTVIKVESGVATVQMDHPAIQRPVRFRLEDLKQV